MFTNLHKGDLSRNQKQFKTISGQMIKNKTKANDTQIFTFMYFGAIFRIFQKKTTNQGVNYIDLEIFTYIEFRS